MKKVAKILLMGSVAAFALSFTGPGGEFLWGILKPMGALLFGAFFITNLVAKEYAKYDLEQRLKQPARPKASSTKSTPGTTGRFGGAGLLADAAAK
jgi:hypothetical protein